ncbi:response regulator receiver [Roseobacter sp. CCS2]|uniref:response regulator receiver n=1 Tax=Roseobacter sp. CCS2 TaxID=391593 RepID=UPI0000F3C763|nr:response regulator receiver [Roseobacter sp. CCS2]EBA11571.1 Response regulator receiver [Roseobacter sp. CCS2]
MLRNKCILVVEDEPLIGLDILLTLEEAGASVEGPYRSIAETLSKIEQCPADDGFDGAVLDYRLLDGTCEPIIQQLKRYGIPMILHSGNAEQLSKTGETLKIEVVSKPSHPTTLLQALERCVRVN